MSAEIQYDLYFAAFLNGFAKNVLIPDFLCESFDLAHAINQGLNSNENHLIFFSPDLNKVPDFSLPVRETLNLEVDGCYFGKIVRAFSKSCVYFHLNRFFIDSVNNLNFQIQKLMPLHTFRNVVQLCR